MKTAREMKTARVKIMPLSEVGVNVLTSDKDDNQVTKHLALGDSIEVDIDLDGFSFVHLEAAVEDPDGADS